MADPISTVTNSTGPGLREKETLDDMANSPIAQFFQRRAAEAPQFVEGLKTLYNDPSKMKELDTVKDAINNFSLPGDVYAGRLDPMSDESIKRSIGLAQNLAGQAPFNPVQDAAGIFGGRLSRTAPQTEMDIAEQILNHPRNSIPDQAVWKEFGAMKGPEGKMKYEIDDSKARLNPDLQKINNIRMKDALEHPELYAAYPEIGNYKVELNGKPDDIWSALFNKQNKTITLNPHHLTKDEQIISTILHEAQHGVQDIEGFVPGAHPDHIINQVADRSASLDPKIINAFNDLSIDQKRTIAMNLYKRQSGEAESRLVERRMNDTAETRRNFYPLDDQAALVPPDKLIIPYEYIK